MNFPLFLSSYIYIYTIVSALCAAHTADNGATEAWLSTPSYSPRSLPPVFQKPFSVINRNYMHMSMMFSPVRPLAVGGLYVVIIQWQRTDNKTIYLYIRIIHTYMLYVLAFFPRLRVPWRTCALIDSKNINIKNI